MALFGNNIVSLFKILISHKSNFMNENTNKGNQQRNQDVLRDDLHEKHKQGSDTRAGSTFSDMNASEWKQGDKESQRTSNPETGSAISDAQNEDPGRTPAG